MEKLLEQAKQLVADLQIAKTEAAAFKTDLDNKANAQVATQATLDQFQAELIEREVKVKPVENAQRLIEEADKAKAAADLEWVTINSEWDKLSDAKADQAKKAQTENAQIAEQKVLYDRGAKENAEAKAKLDSRLKKFEEAKAGV